jgi:nickel-dependent lactate racemase
MGQKTTLHVGTRLQTFELPFKNIEFGKAACAPEKVPDLASEVKKSLLKVNGQVDMKKLNSGSKVVIVCDDYTRPTPAAQILPPLIEFLHEKGVLPENIDILIAAGFHREMSKEEKLLKYGEYICYNYRIRLHNALDYR